jgi:hypothetical protein
MPHPTPRARRKRAALALAFAALLVPAGTAHAAGLQNASFENGLDGWTAEILHAGDHGAVEVESCEEPQHDPQRTVCVVEAETLTPAVGVTPLDGTKMVRLGGPFGSPDEPQVQDRYRLRQTFTVDRANPVLALNYNVFLFDNHALDELRFEVTDGSGATIAEFVQRGFGAFDDTRLKSTGWRSAHLDLAGYENEQVHLTVDSGGGGQDDTFYGFWAYLDAGQAPAPPVSSPSFTAAAPNPVSGAPVQLNAFSDPGSGRSFVALSASEAAAFPSGCVPTDVTVPIAGAVSDVTLLATFYDKGFPLSAAGGGEWRGPACISAGDLAVQYTLDEGLATERLAVVPTGGTELVDPLGVVYDQARYDAAVAGGAAPGAARAAAAIEGATVRLQREVGGAFRSVLAGDPHISPRVNPETTGANGEFQWLAGAGTYRVVVSKPGFQTAVTRAVALPGVTDLHVGLSATPAPPGGGGGPAAGGGGGGSSMVVGPPAPPAGKAACAGLRGTRLAKCKRAQKLAKAIAACRKGKKSRRALCIRRAKALAKCEALARGAKRRRCVARARRIGGPVTKRDV